MTHYHKHPNDQQLQRFISGRLSKTAAAETERHVSRCEECVKRLAEIPADSWSRLLKDNWAALDDKTFRRKEPNTIPCNLSNHERYAVVRKIGSGGMGDVYLGKHRSLNRFVAIKVLCPRYFSDDRAILRFRNEIQIAAKLNHPNIVQSHDAETSGHHNVLFMEYIDGKSLSEMVCEDGVFNESDVCNAAIRIAHGLQYAHSSGMIHRDIKPHNVLVDIDGHVKIADFGLAKFTSESTETNITSLTLNGEIMGTPDFVSPEQIQDSLSADLRSDIYSLGCTLYFMMAGRPPFPCTTTQEKLESHRDHSPDCLHRIRGDLNAHLVTIVERMMRKNPKDRFQNYEELLLELESCRESLEGRSGDNRESRIAINPILLNASTPQCQHRLTPNMTGKLMRPWFGGLAVLMTIFAIIFVLRFDFSFGQQERKIAIVVPAKFAWHPEIAELYRYFEHKPSITIEWIADQTGEVTFHGTEIYSNVPARLNVNRTLEQVTAAEFDGVIFTGGWNGYSAESTVYAFEKVRSHAAGVFLREMIDLGRPVASVSGGTAVLANCGILEGVHVANYRYISNENRRNSGAIWSRLPRIDEECEVVTDGVIITAGNYVNTSELCDRILRQIDSKR